MSSPDRMVSGLADSLVGPLVSGLVESPPGGGGGPSGDALLMESGDYILLESGDYLLLE